MYIFLIILFYGKQHDILNIINNTDITLIKWSTFGHEQILCVIVVDQ